MSATYIAVIKGPIDILGGKLKFEKLEITNEDIQEYLDECEEGSDEGYTDALKYHIDEYINEWEQRLCTVTLLSVEQFELIYDDAENILASLDDDEEDDSLDEWEEEEAEEDDYDSGYYKTFGLSKAQYDKYNEWRKSKDEVYVGAVGGAYEFCFIPTGIGPIVKVKCEDGTELDLTEYDLF